MISLAQKLYSKYRLLARMLFFILLFGVLSFGRAFSIIHIEVHSLPIFVTEIVLFISLPLIITNRRELLKIPPLFLSIFLVYFLFGCFYLLWGLLNGNLFALRDFICLCGYMLFLPLVLICFKSLKSIKLFLSIIVFANFIIILIGQVLIFGACQSWLYGFISKVKTFQIGIVYGISSVFLLVFYNYLKNKVFRLLILLLVSINLYMLIIFGVRSLWVAVICLAVFLMLISGFRVMVKVYFKLLISFLLVSSVLFYVNFVVFKSLYLNILIGRGKSFVYVFDGTKGVKSSNAPLSSKHDESKLRGEAESNGTKGVKSTNAPLSNKHDKLMLRGESERIGRDNIVWRIKIWSQTMKFTSGSYLFGKGFGRYPTYDVWGYQKPRSAFTDSGITPTHNYLLTIFYKMGFLGLALFLFINIYIFYYAIRYLKKCNSQFLKLILAGALGALVFWHTVALFFDVIDSPPTSIFLWILIGVIFAAVKIDEKVSAT